MSLPQTVIESSPATGYEGQLSTGGYHDTYARKNASGVGIPFGRFLIIDTGTVEAMKLPSSLSDVIKGVSLYEPAIEQDANGLRQYEDKSMMAVTKRGTVTMITEQDVVPGDAVYARVTVDGGDATKTPGRLRKDSAGAIAAIPGTARKQTLTLSGALDAGQQREQTLTLSAALAANDTVDLNVDGQAITQVVYATSADLSMTQLLNNIKAAADLAAAGPGGVTSILDVIKVSTTVLRIISRDLGDGNPTATAITGTAFHDDSVGGGASGTVTMADVVIGKKPHLLSIQVDGAAAITQAWEGTSDLTLAEFAKQVAQQAGVASAVVTKVTDAAAPGDSDRVIVVTSSANGPATTVFTNPLANTGKVARTMAVAETVAGVADQAAVNGKAIAVPSAEIMTAALAGKPCWVRLNF